MIKRPLWYNKKKAKAKVPGPAPSSLCSFSYTSISLILLPGALQFFRSVDSRLSERRQESINDCSEILLRMRRAA